ncbi:hypothetical protein J6590_092173 [Homalodisca vitripennis]|nr:hypothetical protein J6590_092173 [Homalodisca vitripennis]
MSLRNKNLPKTGNSRVKRTTWLSDEEVWDCIRDLNSDEVLVLSKAECLNIRFLYSQSQPSFIACSNFKLLLAPISNSTLPPKYGSTQNLQSHCNSEGTHWSLIILNRVEGKYVHLDSLRGVNSTCALDFCNSLDKVLSNQNISFEENNCKRQNNSFSCGFELIKNAKSYVSKYNQSIALNGNSSKVILNKASPTSNTNGTPWNKAVLCN